MCSKDFFQFFDFLIYIIEEIDCANYSSLKNQQEIQKSHQHIIHIY
jgi:hypothetical protein